MAHIKLPKLPSLYRKIGVDFGSRRLRVCTDVEGVVYDQPSCIAIDERTHRVIATGSDAAEIEGRLQSGIAVHWPVREGRLFDANAGLVLLRQALSPQLKTALLYGPELMMSVAGSSTPAEQAAMVDLGYAVGAREVHTIAQPLAAAIGSGVPIADPSGGFVLDLGEGLTETAVVSLGSMVSCEKTVYAGSFLRRHLQLVIAQEVGLAVSPSSLEKIAHSVAALQTNPVRELLVTGKDIATNRPREAAITSEMIHPAVLFVMELTERVIKRTLEDIPAELTVDIIDKGLLLTGGLSQLHGLDLWLIQSLGMPVSVVDNPDTAVIRGIETTLKHLEAFKESLGYLSGGQARG